MPKLGRYPLHVVLAAVLLPALLLLAARERLLQPPDVHGHAALMAEELRRARDVRVVILGSSLAHRGFDLPVLARELGVRVDQIVLLQLPHASVAHWYAILKNRVYAEGHAPKLVIVAGALTTMLNHDLLQQEANVDRLVEQLTEDEPVIASKVFGFEDPGEFRRLFARERAGEWRDAFLEGWRDRVVALLFTRRNRVEEASRLVARVNERVFANERMAYELHREATPDPLRDLGRRSESFDLRRDGLVGDVQALADAHGSRVVWVRMPFPPSNHAMDEVPPDIETEALAWMEEVGAGYLDMRTLELTDADFEDMRHLSPRGAVTFTTAVARALDALGALRGGEVGVVRGLGEVAGPELVGRLPALPEPMGEGCTRSAPAGALAAFAPDEVDGLPAGVRLPFEVRADGVALPEGDVDRPCTGAWALRNGRLVVEAPRKDAVVEVAWLPPAWRPDVGGPMAWVLPGTTLAWSVPEGWRFPPRAFVVLARGLAVGTARPAASLQVQGLAVPMQGTAGRLVARAQPVAPDGPWTVSVTVPSGHAPVLLHHLAVGLPPATTALLGTAETLQGASVRIVGGRLEDTRTTAVYAAPPAWTPPSPRVRPGPRRLGAFHLPGLAELADAPTPDLARPSACSPLRVLEDGVPLANPHAPCADLPARGHGRTCHAGEMLYFAASDDSSPLTNERSYTLALDESRACAVWFQKGAAALRGSWWLYPGDEVALTVPGERLAVLRDGANRLVLEAITGTVTAPLEVRLIADGHTVLDATWRPERDPARRSRGTRLLLDPPLSPATREVTLVVRNPGEGFHLLTLAALEEAYAELAEVVRAAPADGPAVERPLPPVASGRDRVPSLPAWNAQREIAPEVVEARLFALWPVSNAALEKIGAPPVSPLRLHTVDGLPLRPTTLRREVRTGCEGCFLHLGQAVLWRSPEGAEVRASLDPAFPSVGVDGSVAWWVYPESTAWLDVGGLEGEAVEVRARVVALHPQREQAGRDLFLRIGAREVPFESVPGPGLFEAVLQATPTGGALRVELVDRSERGYALLTELVVRDAAGIARVAPERPLALTGELAAADIGGP